MIMSVLKIRRGKRRCKGLSEVPMILGHGSKSSDFSLMRRAQIADETGVYYRRSKLKT
jgi:hypothetical protein